MSAILFLGIGVLIVFSNTDQPSYVPANPPSDDDPSKNPKESFLDKMKRLLKKGQEKCEKIESKTSSIEATYVDTFETRANTIFEAHNQNVLDSAKHCELLEKYPPLLESRMLLHKRELQDL